MNKKTLRVPNEPKFIRALAMAVEPADALALLLEIGALDSQNLAPVRKIRESLSRIYDIVSAARDWEATDVVTVLLNALASPDNQAYLAYHREDKLTALATIYGVAYSASYHHRRPWTSEPDQRAYNVLLRILTGGGNLLPPGREQKSEPVQMIIPTRRGKNHN